MNHLPKERLSFFRINARTERTFKECAYCHKVMTKGRDGLGDGQCDKCLTDLLSQRVREGWRPSEEEE